MLNYSKFTKQELIEAIQNCKDTYILDNHLTYIYAKKSKYYIEESSRLSKKLLKAVQENDYDAAVELKKQYNNANKQYERLNKAIDEV